MTCPTTGPCVCEVDPDFHDPRPTPPGGPEFDAAFAEFCAPIAPSANTKPSNPKDAIGSKKVPFSTVPSRVVAELGLALLEGAAKYGRHNYRAVGVRASVYFDAAFRHLTAWWEGQDIDPDSGLSHITKAMASLAVLRDSMIQENWQDDRPPALNDANWVASLNAEAERILAKYPEPKAAFTQTCLPSEAEASV